MNDLTRQRLEAFEAGTLATVLLETVQQHPACCDTVCRLLAERSHEGPTGNREPDTSAAPYMVGSSPAMQTAFDEIRRYAPYHVPVLVTGESGTGKELAARALHERSPYADGPFVALNCGAIPSELVSSELFGHEKGAFTGAVHQRIGYFERADHGTLFLDEIGQLPLEVQSSLLRVLQEGSFQRVGGQTVVHTDTRIVAATNTDLETAVQAGRFREDLFYRLNVLRVHLPPLRDRKGDIRLLARYFTSNLAREMGIDEPGLSEDALAALEGYHWPGNVREFISTIRRAMVIATDGPIDVQDLDLRPEAGGPRPSARSPCPNTTHPPGGSVATEQAPADDPSIIANTVARCGGNKSEAARVLGISRVTLYRRLKRTGGDHRGDPDPPTSKTDGEWSGS